MASEYDKYATVKQVETGIWLIQQKIKTSNRMLGRAISHCLDIVESTTPEFDPCAIIYTTDHPRIFSAGLDFSNFNDHPEDVQSFLLETNRVMARILSLGIPTIAAINGDCYAAGCMMSHVMDFRIMRPDHGRWCVSEILYGLHVPPGMSSVLQVKIDSPTYVKACFYAHKFTPQECLESKIIDRLSTSGKDLVKEAIEWARELSEKGRNRKAYSAIKQVMYEKQIETCYYRSSIGYQFDAKPLSQKL